MINKMTVVKRIYGFAGVYGLLALIPSYFLEKRISEQFPPPITHPEYYYGFLGVALAFQIIFFMISANPVRFRPIMIACVLEKMSFGAAVGLLMILDRIPFASFVFGMIDL